jgi:hypothetical protein
MTVGEEKLLIVSGVIVSVERLVVLEDDGLFRIAGW